MLGKLAAHVSYANVMATLAMFIALGGGAYAITNIPRNSIGALELKAKVVGENEIKNESITSSLIKKGAVGAEEIAKNAVRSDEIKKGSLLLQDFKAGQIPQGPTGPQGPKGDTGAPPPVEGYKAVSLTNGFISYDEAGDGTGDVPVRIYKDPFGIVHIEGAVERSSVPPDFTTIFVLPEGYRPSGGYYLSFAVITTGHNDTDEQLGYVQVAGDGRVDYVGGKVGYLSLTGVSFRAA